MTLDTLPIARNVPAVTAAQMAEADRVTAELGIPLAALMENAAHQIAAATRAFLGDVEGKLVVALVGSGNNGGDALGALRHLAGWGAQVDAYLAAPDRLRPLARLQYDVLARLGVALYDATSLDDRFLAHRLSGRHVLLDGLLGYSAAGAPYGQIERLIRVANQVAVSAPVIAVDVPSGLDPDTGWPLGPVAPVRAALTVTLALPKAGLLRPEARGAVGQLVLADIGIPAQAYGAGVEAGAVFAAGDLVRIIL